MYNKYIGNTGKFIRVEDHPSLTTRQAERSMVKPPTPHPISEHSAVQHPNQPPPPVGIKKKPSLFGGFGGGLNGLLGGLGGGLGGISNGFKGMFDHLPFGLDLGDILLFLLLLFFFFESGDEEFIIILAVIAYSMFKDR